MQNKIIAYKKYNLDNSLKFLLKIKNPSLPVRDILAQIYILKNNLAKALKYRPLSPFIEAEIYYKMGEYNKAIEIINKFKPMMKLSK